MVQAAYFSKKLGRPVLPELVALNNQSKVEADRPAAGESNTPEPDRKRRPVNQ
jgi:hypothetical protein